MADDDEGLEAKCKHPPCCCKVTSGQKYCSECCKDTMSEDSCECGHKPCSWEQSFKSQDVFSGRELVVSG